MTRADGGVDDDLDPPPTLAMSREVPRHAEPGQGEPGEDADRVEGDQLVHAGAGPQDEDERDDGQHDDAVGER
ncbi:MAG: hypothetical protein ABJA74_02415 [Lapillicoccus sp.]